MPYQFPNNFYLKQIVILLIFATLFLVISRYNQLDFFLSDLWFDAQLYKFPLTDNYWLEVVNHHYLKYFVISIALILLILGAFLKKMHWIAIALMIASGPMVVGLIKSFSHHSCPWDLVRYGGRGYEYPLLGHISEFPGKGKCFPGGHASGGFGLLALYFLFFPISKRLAKWVAAAAICLGMIMGFGQVMRGAHFFSHNLWSLWWGWATQVTVYYIYTFLYYRKETALINASS